MELSIIQFFITVKKREVFCTNNIYCIFGTKIFPFFFSNHLKKILLKYEIEDFFFITFEELNDKSFFFRQDIVYRNYEKKINNKICLIISVQEKNYAEKILPLLNTLSPNFYYLFFIPSYILSYQKQLIWYNIEKIIDRKNKTDLIIHLQDFLEKNKFKEIYSFLMYSYDLIDDYATIEYLLKLLAYLPCIKKNKLEYFLNSYIKDMSFAHTTGTIFDLATAFFQKKRDIFYSIWFYLKDQYSFEYWYYFWVDQIWYCSLAVIHQKFLIEISYSKKINKWFLKYGAQSYDLKSLTNAFHYLYRIDYLHKKYNHSIETDMKAFFIFWFK